MVKTKKKADNYDSGLQSDCCSSCAIRDPSVVIWRPPFLSLLNTYHLIQMSPTTTPRNPTGSWVTINPAGSISIDNLPTPGNPTVTHAAKLFCRGQQSRVKFVVLFKKPATVAKLSIDLVETCFPIAPNQYLDRVKDLSFAYSRQKLLEQEVYAGNEDDADVGFGLEGTMEGNVQALVGTAMDISDGEDEDGVVGLDRMMIRDKSGGDL